VATVFVSDLHLDGSQPQTIKRFVDFLAGEARGAEAVYILGDLFEIWLGDDLVDASRLEVCQAMQALTQAGVPLFVMRGNRDFLLDSEFAILTGAQLLPDPVCLQLDGIAMVLTHGDLLCSDDRSYQQLRSLVHEPGWRQNLLTLSAKTRDALAAIARTGSRKHMAKARPAIMDVNLQTVERVFAAANAELMIHGHTHRPGTHEHLVNGRRCKRIVLDAWYDGGQCVWFDAGTIREQRLG
jgi:UDP-2,3-diacylglucosamine hydrolase